MRSLRFGWAIPVAVVVGTGPGRAAADPAAVGLVERMIEAHGGYEPWRQAPSVGFTDEFLGPGETAGEVSNVVVEQGPRRAVLDYPGTGASVVWDGKTCWSVGWKGSSPPRFLALLNYYFLNLPWLTRDPGVRLSLEDSRRLWDGDILYHAVRMTFDSGVGDTPDDYYVLYIDPGTHLLKACEYIVTYADLLPPGVSQSPPHILVFDEYAVVEGLTVPVHYTIFEIDHREYASCRIRDWSFSTPFDASRMIRPEGAVVDTSRATREESGK